LVLNTARQTIDYSCLDILFVGTVPAYCPYEIGGSCTDEITFLVSLTTAELHDR